MARIIVVEDEPVTATDLEHKLTLLGHEVVAWSDTGEDAVAQAAALAPDLVLMDIRLGSGISGIEAARQLRQHSDVPIVFLTAFADQDTVDRACETFPYGYLLKPFTERSLVAAVQVALSRAREEQALSARERWVSAGLRTAGEALVAVDERGTIRFMNEHAETLLRLPSSEALGKDVRSIVPLSDAHAEGATHPIDLVLRDGRVISSPDGSQLLITGRPPITIAYSAAPVQASGQSQEGAVLVLRELPLPPAVSEVEPRAALSALSMRLSHEINNPLTYNLGALQLALRELDALRALASLSGSSREPSAAGREAQLLRIELLLRDAQEGASRVAGVMRELGALSAPDDESTPIQPTQLLNLAVGLSGLSAQQVRFERQIGPTPLVRGNKWQLTRVVAHAMQDIVNELGAPSGEPSTLLLALGTDARGWAELRIVAPARATPAAVPRTGLSPIDILSQGSVSTLVAQQLVARQGGELSVSEGPEGRVVRLCLPPMSVAAAQAQASASASVMSRGSVLVIDDEALANRVLELSLRPEYDVTAVQSAEDGLALLERGDAFDAILCDLTMPGMGGREFCERLSAARPDLAERVILMTGGACTESDARFVKQMHGRCIFKPFSTRQLVTLLAERVGARTIPPSHGPG